MYIKITDGTQYPIVRIGSRSDVSQGARTVGYTDFQITFDAQGKNITNLIKDIQTRFADENNLKNIQVFTDTMEYPSLFNFSSLGQIVMNINASSLFLDAVFHKSLES